MAQSLHGRYEAALKLALRCQGLSPEAVEAEVKAIRLQQEASRVQQEVAVPPPASVRTSPSSSETGGTGHNPANQLWFETSQRENFMRQLKTWASNHDSSAHFHGSISLHPPGAVPGERVELGRSVNCLLSNALCNDSPTKIVIRLYQTKSFRVDVQMSPKTGSADFSDGTSKDAQSRRFTKKYPAELVKQQHQSVPPYHLVIRSGSGWLAARHFLDKHHFNTRAKKAQKKHPQPLATAVALEDFEQCTEDLRARLEAPFPAPALQVGAPVLQIGVPAPLAISHVPASSPTSDRSARMSAIRTRVRSPGGRGVSKSQTSVTETESSTSEKDIVKVSPLFHAFSRLPQEIQDEILYHAIGHTGKIKIHREKMARDILFSSEPPITISKLLRISKSINEHMTAHIFNSTCFQFGTTGFTNFLWQIGPTNRSHLRSLSFRFGKGSLLHCVRWLAPDAFWELFQPPVTTDPPSLAQFWRCQIRDLMRELTLLKLTIDIRDVPPTDVPLLVRVLKSAMGSTHQIRIIDKIGSGKDQQVLTQALHRRFPGFEEPTWRELALRYYADYKHLRWHMLKNLSRIGVRPVLEESMDHNRAFFDA